MAARKSNKHGEIFAAGKKIGDFVIIQHIGGGGYGECYSVKDETDSSLWAMKVEHRSDRKRTMDREIKIIKIMDNSPYFPNYRDDGLFGGRHYLTMELLGPSLSAVRKYLSKRRFSAYSYLKLSIEMLESIHEFHRRGFVHRDIKPANFLIKPDRERPLVLIDYGLASNYLTEKGHHIACRTDKGFVGTTRYASINAHKGMNLSRRDDLISWFYSVLEMATGYCPWPGRADQKATAELKEMMSAEVICQDLPAEFCDIYIYITGLHFHEKPDYGRITRLIRKALEKGQFESLAFDWETLPASVIKKISPISLNMDREETSDNTEKCCNVC